MITKESTQENLGRQGNRGCWRVCKAEGIQIYSTLSETEAVFAERTKRSLKNISYPYM